MAHYKYECRNFVGTELELKLSFKQDNYISEVGIIYFDVNTSDEDCNIAATFI